MRSLSHAISKEPRIPYTKAGYEKLLEQQKQLQAARPEAVENLRKAREMGDLSENGYYKAARARLSFLDAEIRRADRLVRLGIVVESIDDGSVGIGNTVVVSDGLVEKTYMIVGGYESDPTKGTISYLSPLGKALMGKKIDDTVNIQTPSGKKISYKIVSVD